ncbi:MAG: NAD-dependent epimerase/dehydratase family protein [Sphingobacteriales bacterium]|nr:MAG: NAD-dependent epimerase/dehydratase family protein [Sphingobacteriales bacterium]
MKKISEISAIVHLAAKAGVRLSMKDPSPYQEVNVCGTHNLLDFATNEGIPHFVFASSSSVYGDNSKTPWREDDKLMPISHYASTKIAGEELGSYYSSMHGIRFIALRLFTVYGPGQRPDLAIFKFLSSILQEQPISVYGNGDSLREYTFISDVVTGICEALNYRGSSYECINIGGNEPINLMFLIRLLENISKKKAIIHHLNEQLGDVKITHSDSSKAKLLLNYTPTIKLLNGLTSFYTWYVENHVC